MLGVAAARDVVWVLDTNRTVLHFVDWAVARLGGGYVHEKVVTDDVDHDELSHLEGLEVKTMRSGWNESFGSAYRRGISRVV